MKRTELQNYVIKRQFIEKIDNKTIHHISPSQKLFKIDKIQFTLFVENELNYGDTQLGVESFLTHVFVTLAQWLMLEIPVQDIINNEIKLPEILLTEELIQWDLPAIEEILKLYFQNDSISNDFVATHLTRIYQLDH